MIGHKNVGGGLLMVVLVTLAFPVFSAPGLLNDMQGCQAGLDFIVSKVDARPPNISATDLADSRGRVDSGQIVIAEHYAF